MAIFWRVLVSVSIRVRQLAASASFSSSSIRAFTIPALDPNTTRDRRLGDTRSWRRRGCRHR